MKKQKMLSDEAAMKVIRAAGRGGRRSTLDPEKIAAAINVPVKEWPGRCHEIAGLALTAGLVEGRLRYGMWHGPIDPKAPAFGGRKSMTHHGWVEIEPPVEDDPLALAICECDHVEDEHEPGGFFRGCRVDNCGCEDWNRKKDEYERGALVFDPTRWVFENSSVPYVFEGRDYEGWYDVAGDKLRTSFMRPYPAGPLVPTANNEDYRLGASRETLEFLIDVIAGHGGPRLEPKNFAIELPMYGLGWVANLPLSILSNQARFVYDALRRIDQDGLIPLDNVETVSGDGFYGQKAAFEKKLAKKPRKNRTSG